MRHRFLATFMLVCAAAGPAYAQLPGNIGKVVDTAKGLQISDAEEQQIGQKVSDSLRARFGVVQDKAVHKYVTLVGTVLAQASSRPNLPWTFIVLDTDGVNAFAAPGGYIHITRGAMALIQSESELAGVLAHEISHVTEKHAITSIRNSKIAGDLGKLSGSDKVNQITDYAYKIILEGNWDRGDELDSDKKGAVLANKAGYAPGLGAFLTKLDDRNKDQKERNGLFADHPATKERIDKLTKQVASDKLTATAMVAARYKSSVSFKLTPITAISIVDDSKSAPKSADTKSSGGGGFGLGGLNPLGKEKGSTQTIASGGSRGVGSDRAAKGGDNPALVIVTVTAAEVTDFRKGIAG